MRTTADRHELTAREDVMTRPGWRQQLVRGVSTAAVGALVVAAEVPQELAPADEEVKLEAMVALGYPRAPNSTADAVGLLLRQRGGLERVDLICSWALSPSDQLRHTLAMVLAHMADEVGVPEAIEVLRGDRVASVRIAAEEAATRHQRKRCS